MANGKTGRNNAFRRKSRSDRNLRDAINDAIDDAMKGASGPVMSDLDQQLLNQMRDKFSGDILGEAGKTISDLDRKMVNEIVGDLPKMMPLKPRMRPDVGAIERGNRAARRTAQDLSRMEDGGVALSGGQKKLDKNKDGKISGEDFKILRGEKKSTKGTKVKKMQGGGQICRGGGAAMRGTNFSGVR